MANDKNTIQRAHELGQSIWLDYLSRKILNEGVLQNWIDRGLRGVTSNPKILDSAITEGKEYDAEIRKLVRKGKEPKEIYETLAIADIQQACDTLRPYFRKDLNHDGFVSLEVAPDLAFKTEATIEEGRRLWRAVDRPNVMIKVPATKEGLPAIRKLTSEGVNINVTLLFGLPRYREVAEAYLDGLEDRLQKGESVDSIQSVASFFLSRIDVLLDPQLEERGGEAKKLRGKVAIASAKLAYQIYRETFASSRFKRFQDQGASPQCLLWGSTSTKNPDYSDVMYPEALVGDATVNTMPEDTLEAFLDHGEVRRLTVEEDVDGARRTLEQLAEVGIDIDEATEQLVQEGVEKFTEPFNHLLDELDQRRAA